MFERACVSGDGVADLISLNNLLEGTERIKWVWLLCPCNIPNTMNMLVRVYNVGYYH